MINLKVADYCHNCPDFIPDCESIKLGTKINWYVFCVAEKRCANMYEHIKEQVDTNEQRKV